VVELERSGTADRMTVVGAELPMQLQANYAGSCPSCMDRLPFASEGVLSEVADMYPAC
jgi:hypothetical protein